MRTGDREFSCGRALSSLKPGMVAVALTISSCKCDPCKVFRSLSACGAQRSLSWAHCCFLCSGPGRLLRAPESFHCRSALQRRPRCRAHGPAEQRHWSGPLCCGCLGRKRPDHGLCPVRLAQGNCLTSGRPARTCKQGPHFHICYADYAIICLRAAATRPIDILFSMKLSIM